MSIDAPSIDLDDEKDNKKTNSVSTEINLKEQTTEDILKFLNK